MQLFELFGGLLSAAIPMSSISVNNVRNSAPGIAGAAGDGVTDDTAAINYWLSQGGLLWVPPGTYRHTSTLNFTANGTICFGSGVAITTFLAAGNFDNVTITSVRGCKLVDLTLDATAQKTAGAHVRIKGGNASYKLPGFNLALGGHTIDVDCNNMFDGVVFEDLGGNGDWNTVIGNPNRQASWRNCASGSHAGIWFNTPNGGGQIVQNIFMTSKVITDTPGPALRYTSAADFTGKSIKQIGMGGSLLVDCTANPSPAGDGLIQLNDCQFDSTSTGGTFDNVKINLGGGVGGAVFINMANVWIAGSTGNGLHVTGNSTPLLLCWSTGTCFSNAGWGVLVDNGAGQPKVRIGQAEGANSGVLFNSNTSGDEHYI